MAQTTHTILMIRPVGFAFNEETAETNAFQQSESRREDAQDRALKEFNQMVRILRDHQINVITIDDTLEPHTPDSIFPNNWISTHENGLVVVYPMQAINRRYERRADIVQRLSDQFVIDDIIDFTAAETQEKFLEGTGSMVLDREMNICYACLSPRTNKELLEQFCHRMHFTPVVFDAIDLKGQPIYHTNVVLCVGQDFLVICLEAIPNVSQQKLILKSAGNKKVISISMDQMNHFAGNMLEVENIKGENFLVMSSTAYHALHLEQITELEKFAKILHAPLETIEQHGGGSARCMMAEIYLPSKPDN